MRYCLLNKKLFEQNGRHRQRTFRQFDVVISQPQYIHYEHSKVFGAQKELRE